LPLLLAGYVVHVAGRSNADESAVGELLIDEFAAGRSLLLPPGRQTLLPHQPRTQPSAPAMPTE
jgi:hypothetical protein